MSKKLLWIKKFVTRKEYDEYYMYQEIYTVLERRRGGYIVGYCVVTDEVPIDNWECSPDDLQKIKKSREESNIYPLPEIWPMKL